MKRLHILNTGLAMAALAAAESSGSGAAAAAAPEAGATTDPAPGTATAALAAAEPSTSSTANPADKAAPDADTAKARKAAAKTADANVDAHDTDGDGKLRYRVTTEFHDTTTGKVRKKGRTVKADAERAAVLIAAKVIDPTPLEADAADADDDDDNADPAVNTNAVAPATVGGPVDQAVIADRGEGAPVTDGNRDGTLPKALSTTDAPAIVKGKGGK